MTRKIPRYKLGHSMPEHVGDSIRGIDAEIHNGAYRCDINSLVSGDDVQMGAHYELLFNHGFERKDGKRVDPKMGISDFTAKELTTLFWSKQGHYTISTIETLVKHILHKHPGKGAEIELKRHHAQHVIQRTWDRTGGHPHLMIVKTFAQRPGTPVEDNLPAHHVGYPTLLTMHQPTHVPTSAKSYTDYWRGHPPVWVTRIAR